jgi:hypothetical protein
MESFAMQEPFMKLEEAVHMFYYDSVHGKFKGTVEAKDGKLVINGHAITMFAEKVLCGGVERSRTLKGDASGSRCHPVGHGRRRLHRGVHWYLHQRRQGQVASQGLLAVAVSRAHLELYERCKHITMAAMFAPTPQSFLSKHLELHELCIVETCPAHLHCCRCQGGAKKVVIR